MGQVLSFLKEKIVVGAGRQGIFGRIAERMGLVQREAAKCRGKSLGQMAEMASKNDSFKLTSENGGMAVVRGNFSSGSRNKCYPTITKIDIYQPLNPKDGCLELRYKTPDGQEKWFYGNPDTLRYDLSRGLSAEQSLVAQFQSAFNSGKL